MRDEIEIEIEGKLELTRQAKSTGYLYVWKLENRENSTTLRLDNATRQRNSTTRRLTRAVSQEMCGEAGKAIVKATAQAQ